MENLSLALSLFNQYNFATAKANISNIEYYFQCNPSTQGNQLIEELVKAIKTYEFDAVGEPLFKSILMKCRKTEQESQAIMNELIQWKRCTKEQIAPAAKYLQDICAAAVIQKANKLYEKSPSEYLKFLKNVNFQSGDAEIFSSTAFDKIDINTIVAEQSKGAIPTNVRFINDAFAPLGGIERGQLGIICAPPGVGKTLEAMNLALYMATQGEKVLYVSCADMNMKDFVIRMSAIAFGISFSEAHRNLLAVYDNLKKLVGNNLEISINPAGTVSADDIVDKTMSGNFSVVVVDYDGVLKGVTEGDSMYNTFGDVYNTLTKLSIAGKLVLICSQPKVFSYDKVIGLADIGESSKKQQVVDWIWTISNCNPDCPNHLYIMNLPKARRGRVGAKAYFIRIEGRFIEIPKGLYDQLRMVQEEKHYTEGEIQNMVHAYNVQYQKIQQNVHQASTPQQSPQQGNFAKGVQNPFINNP